MSLHIVLGPSGAGKSEFIKHRLKETPDLIHLDRDKIAIGLIEKRGAKHSLWHGKNNAQITNDILSQELDTAYFEKLETALQQNDINLIIDYVPTMDLKWVEQTISKTAAKNHDIHIEGIFAQPEKILKRVIERNAHNIDLEQETVNILADNRRYFKAWINTYKIFPKQLFSSVNPNICDIKIWNNTEEFTCIAEWVGQEKGQDRVKEIYNQKDYFAFQKLTMINLKTADFQAHLVATHKNKNQVHHIFDVTAENFYE